jgi:hypothetical protein
MDSETLIGSAADHHSTKGIEELEIFAVFLNEFQARLEGFVATRVSGPKIAEPLPQIR